ncbi:MAG: CD225/dispanin family protein [Acidimicrobiia bacterium]
MGGGAPAPGGQIQNYLVLNIIGTAFAVLCCCFVGGIPGIIGIVFSTQVNKLAASGDMAGAMSKANTAKILGIISIALGALGLVGWIINIVTGGWNFSTSN